MPRAGEYRHLVNFEKDVGTPNTTSGQPEESWSSVAQEIWCNVTPLSGRELFAAQQLMTIVTHRIRTRFNPELTIHPRLRAVLGSRVFHIGHVLNVDERDIELEMLCTEVQ